MKTNYEKGRAKEYRLKKKYEKMGYTVLRTAGSHGFADLIAVGKVTVVFIQSKPKKFSETQKKKLEEENKWTTGVKRCFFVVE